MASHMAHTYKEEGLGLEARGKKLPLGVTRYRCYHDGDVVAWLVDGVPFDEDGDDDDDNVAEQKGLDREGKVSKVSV